VLRLLTWSQSPAEKASSFSGLCWLLKACYLNDSGAFSISGKHSNTENLVIAELRAHTVCREIEESSDEQDRTFEILEQCLCFVGREETLTQDDDTACF